MKLYRIDHLTSITATLRDLASEAEAEEKKVVGKHRKEPSTPIVRNVHLTAVHVFHTAKLAWMGLPAILGFEVMRPLWERYVETPLSDVMIGGNTETHTEALSTIARHYFG